VGKKVDESGTACGRSVGRRRTARRCARLGPVGIPRPHDSGADHRMDWTHSLGTSHVYGPERSTTVLLDQEGSKSLGLITMNQLLLDVRFLRVPLEGLLAASPHHAASHDDSGPICGAVKFNWGWDTNTIFEPCGPTSGSEIDLCGVIQAGFFQKYCGYTSGPTRLPDTVRCSSSWQDASGAVQGAWELSRPVDTRPRVSHALHPGRSAADLAAGSVLTLVPTYDGSRCGREATVSLYRDNAILLSLVPHDRMAAAPLRFLRGIGRDEARQRAVFPRWGRQCRWVGEAGPSRAGAQSLSPSGLWSHSVRGFARAVSGGRDQTAAPSAAASRVATPSIEGRIW